MQMAGWDNGNMPYMNNDKPRKQAGATWKR